MGALSNQIESLRGAIKHAPETVDLEQVRITLGYAAQAIDLLDDLTRGELRLKPVEEDGYERWEVTTVSVLPSDIRNDLLIWIGER